MIWLYCGVSAFLTLLSTAIAYSVEGDWRLLVGGLGALIALLAFALMVEALSPEDDQ